LSLITVELEDRSYPIILKRGLLSEVGSTLSDMGFSGRAAVVTNPVVEGLYGAAVTGGLKDAGFDPVVITIPDGEGAKTLETASGIYDELIKNKMERSNLIIALGGGVVGDIAGFAAATYLRGVPYVHLPTTLLAQVDSSVGGKTAVNHPMGKNLIGAFYQPKAVFIDPETLKTLDGAELKSGLAEVVKYGVIWDKDFFALLEESAAALTAAPVPTASGDELVKAIERSCEIKAEVVGADERETGIRSILNFGHTFAHAIETGAGYGRFKHGEAVSIGMVMAAELSARLGLCNDSVPARIKALLSALGLPVDLPELSAEALIESMKLDKKVAGGRIRFVLTAELGKVLLKEVDEEELRAFFSVYST
jgi:3-dehydroquinate synthase